MSTSMDLLRPALELNRLQQDCLEQESNSDQARGQNQRQNPNSEPDRTGYAEEDRACEFTATQQCGPWSPERFAEEQIRNLVRQVFFPGWAKPARHVLFSAVGPRTYVAEICMRVAETLARDFPGNIAVVEANPGAPELETVFGGENSNPGSVGGRPGVLRNSSRQISRNLWLVPGEVFRGKKSGGVSTAWLRGRIHELSLEFDYTIFHGPAAGPSSEAAVLGNLCDGVVLVVEANSTRRVAARQAKEMLYSANAHLLGTVLSERTFPIPEGIYRRL